MEPTANVWPVVDAGTGLVLRYFMRAYAIDGPDALISATLRALAPTDFRMAQMFPIPDRFSVVSEHGTLKRCLTIGGFHEHQAAILESAFAELESSFAPLQGIAVAGEDRRPTGIAVRPRFPESPYLVVTVLLETPDGRLVPQIGI